MLLLLLLLGRTCHSDNGIGQEKLFLAASNGNRLGDLNDATTHFAPAQAPTTDARWAAGEKASCSSFHVWDDVEALLDLTYLMFLVVCRLSNRDKYFKPIIEHLGFPDPKQLCSNESS